MIILIFIIGLISIAYVYLIYQIGIGWNDTQTVKIQAEYVPETGISVIIAVRNEENNIQQCIESILKNNFPIENYEIIVVDDHSTDQTFRLISELHNEKVRVFRLSENSRGKKAAITFGISMASFPHILCTDADCTVSQDWLVTHSMQLEQNDALINSSIVLPETNDSILTHFQFLDFVATMAITANGIFRKSYFLANGANLSFKKATFYDVSGYEGNKHLASGDDIFLINKIAVSAPEKIGFIKSSESIVITKAEPTWLSFVHQRKRWATKAMKMDHSKIAVIQGFVFLYAGIIGLYLLVGLFYSGVLFTGGLVALFIKMITDYLFLKSLCRYFGQPKVMRSFLPCFFLYFIHIILSGFYALRPSVFEWKGRVVR